jgi:hypothetical protein
VGQHVKGVFGLVVSADGYRTGHISTVRQYVLQQQLELGQHGPGTRVNPPP